MADKGTSEETGQLSGQLAMQQGADRRSNPGPDTKEKSNSEPKEKQKGLSGDSSQESSIEEEQKQEEEVINKTKNQGQGPSGDSSRESLPKIQKPEGEEHQKQEEKEKQDETTTPMNENVDIHKNQDQGKSSILQPQITVPGNNSPSGDSSREITSETHSDKRGDGKKDNKPEGLKEESLPKIQKPEGEEHQKQEEKEKQDETTTPMNENVDIHKNQDQGKSSILQPQITVPGNNSPSGDSSRENTTETHSDKRGDGKKDNKPEGSKEGPSGDSSREITSETHSDKRGDGKKDSKPEGSKEESPPNIQKPEGEEQQKQEEKEEQDETTTPMNENVGILQRSRQYFTSLFFFLTEKVWICAVAVILLAVVWAFMYSSDSTPPVPNELNVVDVFNQEMKKLEDGFPNQRPELWRRSLIHLRRHLKTKNPTEPVSLILTSGYRAEKTLGCLAQCLAEAFSTALNSSVLNINGKDKASQDSDQVKLDIDSELKKAFDGKKSAAVVHRFEELPPGSTLIFYRYCDHENAAYKNVFLAFTVMLDAEVEVPSNVNLGRVEEMVQEHIKHKFVSSDKSAMFNQMDIDKLSGLWSRISHLILPVAAEEKIEQQGCGDCNKSF